MKRFTILIVSLILFLSFTVEANAQNNKKFPFESMRVLTGESVSANSFYSESSGVLAFQIFGASVGDTLSILATIDGNTYSQAVNKNKEKIQYLVGNNLYIIADPTDFFGILDFKVQFGSPAVPIVQTSNITLKVLYGKAKY